MPCDGPIITLGTKSNVHYQSLLPLEMLHFDFNENQQDPDVQIQETRKNFNVGFGVHYIGWESNGIGER